MNKIRFFDGGMGTMLQASGLKLGAAAAGGGLSDQVHRAQGLRCLR